MARVWLLCFLAVLSPLIHAQDEQSEYFSLPNSPAMEEVLITGTWSGPKLWKVSKGDHVLWLLGTPDVLPKNMSWDSKEVESVLMEAQEVIAGRTSFSPSGGLFERLRLYLQWRGMQKDKNKLNLKAALSEPLYARFIELKQKYAKNDDKIETLRPMFAAGRLYFAAINSSGLTGRDIVDQTVLKLANKHNVRVRRTSLTVDDPKSVLSELDQTSHEVEVACLAATVARLETDVDAMKQRASAWATGDVTTLRQRLPSQEELMSCWNALTSSPRIRELRTRAESEWMGAAEAALENDRSALAMQSISNLLSADSILDKFRARGYLVEGP